MIPRMQYISIIIRTKNEEKWIRKCLAAIMRQTIQNFEIILVDNHSSDKTVAIASEFPNVRILHVEEFLPGRALNQGVEASRGGFLVFLSAHCIPANERWLESLVKSIENEPKAAGVYGRQLPLPFSSDRDKRDLFNIFGLDRKIQVKDIYFHNANSLVKRAVWLKHKFCERTSNLEDRIWAKEVIDNGYQLVYEPEAAVYHHHGVNHSDEPKRLSRVSKIISDVYWDGNFDVQHSEIFELRIMAIVPVPANINAIQEQLVAENICKLHQLDLVDSIIEVGPKKIGSQPKVLHLSHDGLDNMGGRLSVAEVVKGALEFGIDQKGIPDAVLYVNASKYSLDIELLIQLSRQFALSGVLTIFPGYRDFDHVWYKSGNGTFEVLDQSFKNREDRLEVYRSLYGLGIISSVSTMASGNLLSDEFLAIHEVNRRFRDLEVRSE